MRRYPAFLFFLISLFLTGWGHEGPRVKVGLLLDDSQGKKAFLDRFRSELGSLNADLLMASSAKDPLRSTSALIDQGAQALVVFYDNPKELKGLMARAKGVPVLSVECPLPEAGQTFLVAYDPAKEGELQAKALLSKVPRGIYKLTDWGGKNWFEKRRLEGQKEILRNPMEKGEVRIAGPKTPFEKLSGILVSRASDSFAIQEALENDGHTGKVLVIGRGVDLGSCRAVLMGLQTATVYPSPLKLAEESAYLVTKAARNAKTFDCQFADVPNDAGVVKTVLLTPKLLDKSNLLETLVKDGVYTKEQLEGKKP